MDVILRPLAVTLLYFTFLWVSASGHPLRTHCHLHKYKFVSPSIMSQAKELQNLYELKDRKPLCRPGLRLKKFTSCDLQGMERLGLTQHRISLTVKVLSNMTRTRLVGQNLDAFSILQTELSNCEVTQSTKMKVCEDHLTKYTENVTAGCLEEDVLLNLLWILLEDLQSLIQGKGHEKRPQRQEPQVTLTRPAPKKTKAKKKHKKSKLKATSRS